MWDVKYEVQAKIDSSGVIQTRLLKGTNSGMKTIYDWQNGSTTFKYNDEITGVAFASVSGVMAQSINTRDRPNYCVANWVY